jgi:NAD(P)-dependent dehydrogenase (short-subunit alcohol dehydrogenase family)
MTQLTNMTAIISGGARGMGAAEAHLLAGEGAFVVIGDVLESEGRETLRSIEQAGGHGEFVKLDVRQPDDWARAVGAAMASRGRIDILVNNAGITGSRVPDDDFDIASWREFMDVNLDGAFFGCKAVIPTMVEQQSGSIINISSVAGLTGVAGVALGYQASKGAVRILTKAVAVRYAPYGIRCNAILPGFMPPMKDSATREEMAFVVPMRRFGKVADVAAGVLFLASEASAYVTGTDLIIDGGLMNQLAAVDSQGVGPNTPVGDGAAGTA